MFQFDQCVQLLKFGFVGLTEIKITQNQIKCSIKWGFEMIHQLEWLYNMVSGRCLNILYFIFYIYACLFAGSFLV